MHERRRSQTAAFVASVLLASTFIKDRVIIWWSRIIVIVIINFVTIIAVNGIIVIDAIIIIIWCNHPHSHNFASEEVVLIEFQNLI